MSFTKKLLSAILTSLLFIFFYNTKINAMEKPKPDLMRIEGVIIACITAKRLGYLNLATGAFKKDSDTDSSAKQLLTSSKGGSFDLSNNQDFYQAFEAASLVGDIENFGKLVARIDKKTNTISNTINNSLKLAALAGQITIIEYLFSIETTRNLISPKGLKEALAFAATNNHVTAVRTIISFIIRQKRLLGSTENITDCALISASSKGNIEVVRTLIGNEIILLSFSNKAILNALIITTSKDFGDTLTLLLSKKRIKKIFSKHKKTIRKSSG